MERSWRLSKTIAVHQQISHINKNFQKTLSMCQKTQFGHPIWMDGEIEGGLAQDSNGIGGIHDFDSESGELQ